MLLNFPHLFIPMATGGAPMPNEPLQMHQDQCEHIKSSAEPNRTTSCNDKNTPNSAHSNLSPLDSPRNAVDQSLSNQPAQQHWFIHSFFPSSTSIYANGSGFRPDLLEHPRQRWSHAFQTDESHARTSPVDVLDGDVNSLWLGLATAAQLLSEVNRTGVSEQCSGSETSESMDKARKERINLNPERPTEINSALCLQQAAFIENLYLHRSGMPPCDFVAQCPLSSNKENDDQSKQNKMLSDSETFSSIHSCDIGVQCALIKTRVPPSLSQPNKQRYSNPKKSRNGRIYSFKHKNPNPAS